MNLLITGAWHSAHEYIPQIESYGHRVLFMQQEKESLPCEYNWVEGVICNGLFLYHNIESFSNLKFIQLTSAGFDRVPMDYVKEHDIEILNARGVYSVPMAEFAIAGVLQIYKQSRFFYENQRNHKWEKHRGLLELLGKNVCIVGCGSVGTECAKRFRAFGCEIIGIDLFSRKDDFYNQMLGLDKFEEVLPYADVVVLTLPLTDETFHIIDGNMLTHLKDGSVLVNIARGAIIDTDALIRALDRLGGVVLDVFEEEPLIQDSPLWCMNNVIITPHNSFVGNRNNRRMSDVILKNLEKKHAVNKCYHSCI